jgi:gliding motility-associated-like protein
MGIGTTAQCDSRTFTDPVPSGKLVTNVTINYWSADCYGAGISGSINGFSVPTVNEGNTGCLCSNNPCGMSASSSNNYPCGLPGYSYGGSNTIQICASTAMCINRLEIVLTYVDPDVIYPSISPSGATTFCQGGSVNLDAGTGYSAYHWNTGSTSQTITASTSGTYSVTVTSVTGCTSGSSSQVVTVNPLPSVSISGSPMTICNGSPSVLTASGATNYSWDNGLGAGNPKTVYPSSNTTYNVTGTDGYGCSNTSSVSISVNPSPTVSASSSPATICNGATSSVSASGADTYQWDNGLGSGNPNTVIPSSTTTYHVTGTNTYGCTSTSSATVYVNPLPNIVASAAPPTICNGTSTTISASGGDSYIFDNGLGSGNNFSVTPSSSTTYHVTGTDSNGCQNTSSVTVNVNSLPIVSASSNTPVCSGSVLNLSANGGNTYNWSGPNGYTNSAQNPVISPVDGSNSGTYSVIITDGNGCSATTTTVVTVNALPELTVSSNTPLCSGQDIQLTASSASSYVWSGPNGYSSNAQNPLIPNAQTSYSGSYSITITDANNCSSIGSVFVNVNQTPTAYAGTDTTINNGTTATLIGSASGGSGNYSYSWQPANLVADPNSMTTSTTILSSTTVYTLTVIDNANNCQSADQVVVIIHGSPLNISLTATPNVICQGNSVQLQVTPGGGSGMYTYTWASNPAGFSNNTSNPTVSPIVTTMYYVTVDDGNTHISDSILITVHPLPTVNANASQTSVCTGTQVTLTGSGTATSYVWNNSVINGVPFTPAATMTYIVTGTDANGCSDTASVHVVVNPLPIINTVSSTSVTDCLSPNGTITINATSPLTPLSYSIDNGQNFVATNTFSNLSAGIYSVVVQNAAGCTSTQSVTIQNAQGPQIITVQAINPHCFGQTDGQIIVHATGTDFYTINGGSQTTDSVFSNLAPGIYTIVVYDNGGCHAQAQVTLSQPQALTLTYQVTDISCFNANDGLINLIINLGTPPYTYIWSNGGSGSSISPLAAGLYSVTVTDANGCTIQQSNIPIMNPSALTVEIDATNPICHNGAQGMAIATASGGTLPYQYQWTGNISGDTLTNAQPGNYIVTVVDAHFCTTTGTTTLFNPPSILVTGQTQVNATHQGSIDITVQGGILPYSYLWSNNATTEDISGLGGGIYIVTVNDANNCLVTDTFNIDIPLEIPTVITPNNDGTNDDFEIVDIQAYSKVSLEIYGRWGEKIFVYNGTGTDYANKSNRWNGKYHGKDLPMGSYVYILKLNDEDPITGIVSIIR